MTGFARVKFLAHMSLLVHLDKYYWPLYTLTSLVPLKINITPESFLKLVPEHSC